MPASSLIPAYLSRFRSVDPGPLYQQEDLLLLLAQACARNATPEEKGLEAWKRRFAKYGCGPQHIGYRSSSYLDNLSDRLSDASIDSRMKIFADSTMKAFPALCEAESSEGAHVDFLPDDLLHVTCTGYVAPSPAQRFVNQVNWQKTRVTHCYHMGCSAALPAIHLAQALAARGRTSLIAHTELCSLHFGISNEPQDWVIQSLFADGFVSYRVGSEAPQSGFEIIKLDERILPDTEELMQWSVGPKHFRMLLSSQVPERIGFILPEVIGELLNPSTQPPVALAIEKVLFAVHPGGPRIIDQVASILSLKPWQLAHSRDILFRRGNMSSATLPHIWQRILADREVLPGTPILSLAFGPGLTISGALFVKMDSQ